MYITHKDSVDKRERKGLVSHFMFGQGDAGEEQLAVTWVDIIPGREQRLHHHPEVQVYVIVAGQGRMQVGDDRADVQRGDLVYIPADVPHGITNTGTTTLSYVSCATPAFDLEEAYDRGQLTEAAYDE